MSECLNLEKTIKLQVYKTLKGQTIDETHNKSITFSAGNKSFMPYRILKVWSDLSCYTVLLVFSPSALLKHPAINTAFTLPKPM